MRLIRGVVINPRGSNASGKTTAAREFIKDFPEAHMINVGTSIVTQCSDKVFVLGRYDKKNGGCDTYSGRKQVEETIGALIEIYKPLVIVYEGMIYSTSMRMALDLEATLKPKGYAYHGIYLHRPFTDVLDLLEHRNEGADYSIGSVYNTYKAAWNAYEKLSLNKISIEKVEVEKISAADMGKLIWRAIPAEIRRQL
jgi:hypothetical protein